MCSSQHRSEFNNSNPRRCRSSAYNNPHASCEIDTFHLTVFCVSLAYERSTWILNLKPHFHNSQTNTSAVFKRRWNRRNPIFINVWPGYSGYSGLCRLRVKPDTFTHTRTSAFWPLSLSLSLCKRVGSAMKTNRQTARAHRASCRRVRRANALAN